MEEDERDSGVIISLLLRLVLVLDSLERMTDWDCAGEI